MGRKKVNSENEIKPLDLTASPVVSLDIKYVDVGFNYFSLALSLEFWLAVLGMACCTYLITLSPSHLSIEELWITAIAGNTYRLKSRPAAKSTTVPAYMSADLAIGLLSCICVCYFLSVCCRVVLKAQMKVTKSQLEETLRLLHDDQRREAKKEADFKALQSENLQRAKKKFKPLEPYISTKTVAAEEALFNIVGVFCIIFSCVALCFVMLMPVNQTREFTVIAMLTIFIGGIIAPKVHDDALTMQHYCGVLQNILSGALLFFCAIAMKPNMPVSPVAASN